MCTKNSMSWFSRWLLCYSLLLTSSCAVRWQGRELISVRPLGHATWTVGQADHTNALPKGP